MGQGALSCGSLEIAWTPLSGPDEDDADPDKLLDIMEPEDLLGQEWHAKCSIRGAIDLPLMVDTIYCQCVPSMS